MNGYEANISNMENTIDEVSLMNQTPYQEIILGVRAILPLVIFLMIVLFGILKSKLPDNLVTGYGLVLSIIGMCICLILSQNNIILPNHLFWFFECSGLSSFILFMNIAQETLDIVNTSDLDSSYNNFFDSECFGIEV